jgi:hypothetical protein
MLAKLRFVDTPSIVIVTLAILVPLLAYLF